MAVFVFDSFGYIYADFPSHEWRQLLEVAMEFGWRPERDELPSNLIAYGDRSFHWIEVTKSDAAAMGGALFRASAALRSGSTLSEKQRDLLSGTPLDKIEGLAQLARSGDFLLHAS